MRHLLLLVACLSLGLNALAGEAIQIEPRVRVPGEKPTLAVSESLLESLRMAPDDIAAVKKEVERLNGERQALFRAVEVARNELRAAQKKVDDATAALARQEAALAEFIRQRLPADQQGDYAVREQLQPVVDWLRLTPEQANRLVAKQKELLANDPRARLAAASQAMAARTEPLSPDERRQHVELLKSAAAFNQAWLTNIESVLTDEQKQLWRTRYRRTAFPIEGLAP